MMYKTEQRGVALLITLLLTSVLLGVSASLLNITLKQYLFANIGIASELAFHAANSGMECVLYHDYDGYLDTPPTSPFDVDPAGSPRAALGTLDCMDVTDADGDNGPESGDGVISGEPQVFEFSWGSGGNDLCSIVSVYKYASDSADEDMSEDLYQSPGTTECSQNTVCTIIKSRGYNASCSDVSSGANKRILERELIQRY